jgi:hypothetical protein
MRARRLGSSARSFACIVTLCPAVPAQHLLRKYEGNQQGEQFGYAVANAGDVDGDGVDDAAVGAPYFSSSGASAGRVRMFSGANGNELWSVTGSSGGQLFGWSVSGAGEVNGDNIPDLVVGAVGNGSGAGLVRVLSGANGSLILQIGNATPGDELGYSVAGLGDIDGDGRGDFAVGEPGVDGLSDDEGRVRAFSGASGNTLWVVTGNASERLGHALADAGDIDRDGVHDVIAGMPDAPSPLSAGLVRVFSGASGSTLLEIAGSHASGRFGESVAGVDDVDGDGVGDLLVGAPRALPFGSGWNGVVHLCSGANGAILHQFAGTGGAGLGRSVAGVSDFNADGSPDIVAGGVGASWGLVSVFSGRTFAALITRWDSDGPGFGGAVADAGDADGDGASDLLVGQDHGNTSSGACGTVSLFGGEPGILTTRLGANGAGLLGSSIAPAGDFDGDGAADVLVGAPQESGGAVHVVSGTDGRDLSVYYGTQSGARLGSSVASLGDLDGDGADDYAFGAPYHHELVTLSGFVTVVSGASGATVHTLIGSGVQNRFGYALANIGDVDADGVDDLAVGAPYDDTSDTNGGRVHVFSMASGNQLFEVGGSSGGQLFGSSVSGVDDVDGDSVPDVVVGAIGNGNGAGLVRVLSGASGNMLLQIGNASAGDELGWAVAGLGDVDGDGRGDIAVGEPGVDGSLDDEGRVRAFSGASGQPLWTFSGSNSNARLGVSLARIGDQDCDGVGDLAIGGGDDGSGSGYARVVSGVDGATLSTCTAGIPAHPGGFTYGAMVSVAAIGDADGDGRDEVGVGNPLGGTSGGGHVKVFTLNPRFLRPDNYCAAKTNSLGCAPSISYSGSPQIASGCDDFHVRASDVVPQATGLLLVGTGRNIASAPAPSGARRWIGPSPVGGVYCVLAPRSLAPQRSGGTPGTCSGSFDLLFAQALMAQLGLAAGDDVFVQWWYSDPAHPDGSGIGHTDALHFVIAP